MSTSTYTTVHVVISFIAIGSGIAVMYGLLRGKRLDAITGIFLASTVLTSVTGFGFPAKEFLPSHLVGIVSLIALAFAIVARCPMHMRGAWRRIYVTGAAIALYLNVFVLVVQSFEKVPALKALAPTQKEPPFVVTQIIVMAVLIATTRFAVRRFAAGPVETSVSSASGEVREKDAA